MYCQEDEVYLFWVVGQDHAYKWMEAAQLSSIPLCQELARVMAASLFPCMWEGHPCTVPTPTNLPFLGGGIQFCLGFWLLLLAFGICFLVGFLVTFSRHLSRLTDRLVIFFLIALLYHHLLLLNDSHDCLLHFYFFSPR